MKPKYLFAIPLALPFLLLGLTSCDDNSDERYLGDQSNSSVKVIHSVKMKGQPAAVNDINSLTSLVGNQPVDFSGVWEGSITMARMGELMEKKLRVQFYQEDEIWKAKNVGEHGDYYVIKNLTYKPPLLTYERPSGTSIAGRPMPFFAKLIVTQDEIKGLYKRLASEVGGQQLFIDYDVTFKKVSE